MRVAVVHHWFVTRGGGERVAECIAALFPKAEIFTLLSREEGLPETLRDRKLHTSFLQKLPGARSHHRHLLPLYPEAVQSLDLRGFDLVLTSDSGPVKGVRLSPGAVQICYCHSPMRYLWDGFDSYRAGMTGLTRAVFSATAGRVRRWDAAAAGRVTHFVANSQYVADRIRRCYGREAEVLHPPIDLHRAGAVEAIEPEDHYLCAGRLVPYKRTELLIEACRTLGRRLRIAGTGPEEAKLRRLVQETGGLVDFLGALPTEQLWQEYAHCRALLFAADEDFGMVPLEAQACGRPVIAYGAGGSLETVRGFGPAATGAYFPEQTAKAAAQAIREWEQRGECTFRAEDARGWAAGFATPLFLDRYRALVLRYVPEAAGEAISAAEASTLLAR
ncbi:MAG: glycosyltransferase [Janthinobacterium lividum]